MTSNDFMTSPLERRSDEDWMNFVSSAVNSPPQSDDQQLGPESPSWVLPEEFTGDFDFEPEPDPVQETRVPPPASDVPAVSSGPMSQTWTLPLNGYGQMSLDRKGQDKALTESIVAITETGSRKSFLPSEFDTRFKHRGSKTRFKPWYIRYESLECLAIPRPANGVVSLLHTDIPKSKEEYDKIRADTRKTKQEIVKAFSTRDWKGEWETQA